MAKKPQRKAEDQLLMALACGATVESAARQCGLAESTVYRRLNDPAFSQRLQSLRSDMIQRTAGALTAAATEAVRTLLALQDSKTPPATRLGAAKAVLEIGIKLRESAALEARIAELEARLAALALPRAA
jgi:hypothetical protein